jgi:hypothetical protein
MREYKLAKVPVNVWENNKKIAKIFGSNSTVDGFEITNKILNKKFKIYKRKRKGGKIVWELKFTEL